MFEGFTLDHVDVEEATLRVRYGGAGPPVLLLHRHPREYVTWHRVVTGLAGDYTVVCPDLRGYGESSKPPTTPDHEPYSTRARATWLVWTQCDGAALTRNDLANQAWLLLRPLAACSVIVESSPQLDSDRPRCVDSDWSLWAPMSRN